MEKSDDCLPPSASSKIYATAPDIHTNAYKIFFGAEADSGDELYPAEAMLALVDTYRLTRDARYLDSVERSFAHYKRAYYDRGRVQPDFLVFFANWQSQAG